jgi:hypothetical protein
MLTGKIGFIVRQNPIRGSVAALLALALCLTAGMTELVLAQAPELIVGADGFLYESDAGRATRKVVLRGAAVTPNRKVPKPKQHVYDEIDFLVRTASDTATNPDLPNGHSANLIRIVMESTFFNNTGADGQYKFYHDANGTGPVGLKAWENRFFDYFNADVLPVINYCRSKGVYIMLDMHFVDQFGPNASRVITRLWQVLLDNNYDDDNNASTPNKYRFIRAAVRQPDVLLQVMNECGIPETGYADLDAWWRVPATTRFVLCKNFYQGIVNQMRGWGATNLIVCGSSSFCTDFAGVNIPANQLTGGRIIYDYHLYPKSRGEFLGRATVNTINNQGIQCGGADLFDSNLPMMVGEFSWTTNSFGQAAQRGTTTAWGRPFRNYLDGNANRQRIHLVAWQFDPDIIRDSIPVSLATRRGEGPILINGCPSAELIKSREHYGWFTFQWFGDIRRGFRP